MRIGAAVSVCANCGKEGDDVNNVCNKCKQVRYCNAACKKKHRHKHKKECEEHIRLATEKHDEELRLAAELHDEALFKEPPSQYGDCPVCFLQLPSLETGSAYYSCCGKVVCCGCGYAPVYDNQGNIVAEKKCPFCRIPWYNSTEEAMARLKKRVEVDDPNAIYTFGCYYARGLGGFPQDMNKALELFRRAGKLGHSEAYGCIGNSYNFGSGSEVNKEKARHYYELAAMGGCTTARFNLGNGEVRAGNIDRALKHYMIAAGSGDSESLKNVKILYAKGDATKEDYTTALRSYQEYS